MRAEPIRISLLNPYPVYRALYGTRQQNGKNGPLSPGAAVGVKVKSCVAAASAQQRRKGIQGIS